MPSPDDLRLIDRLHGGFPLSDRPFAAVAADIGCSEDALIERLQRLLAHGDLTRFGPTEDVPQTVAGGARYRGGLVGRHRGGKGRIQRAGGRFVLAAMAVPEERFEAVAAQLGALNEIAHNYRRESAHPDAPGATPLNMWFVIAVESADQIDAVVERIESLTGLPVYAFPKEREFFVELRLPLLTGGHHAAR